MSHSRATASKAMRQRFSQLGIAFREQDVPSIRLRQLFVEDPNKVMVELNFPGAG